jgi:hypothetical protein
LLLSSVVSAPALALDEGDWQIGLSPQLALQFPTGSGVVFGGGARLDARHGLTDALSAWGALASTWFPEGGPARFSTISGGLALAYDVVRVVPFVDLGVALLDHDLGRGRTQALGFEIAVGAEYLIDPVWSLALTARWQAFVAHLGGMGSGVGGLPIAALRLAYRL